MVQRVLLPTTSQALGIDSTVCFSRRTNKKAAEKCSRTCTGRPPRPQEIQWWSNRTAKLLQQSAATLQLGLSKMKMREKRWGFPPPPPFEMHGCIYPRMHTHARVSTAQHQRSENLARGGKKPWTHVSSPLKSITIPSEKGILVVAVSHWKSLVENVKRNRLFAREVAAKWGRCVLLERAEVGAALRLALEDGVVCWARGICCKQPEPTP